MATDNKRESKSNKPKLTIKERQAAKKNKKAGAVAAPVTAAKPK